MAHLICRREIHLDSLADPLLAACRRDNHPDARVIDEALERMATAPLVRPRPLVRVTPDHVRALKAETTATLKDPKVVESIRYSKYRPDASGREGASVPAFLLPLREAIEASPAMLDLVRGSVGWLQVILPLYGGAGNLGAPAMRHELLEGRARIGSPLVDPATQGRIAAHLDNHLQRPWEEAQKAKAEFNPAFMFRDSPLTPLLVEYFARAAPPTT